jgi:hypothetical protein
MLMLWCSYHWMFNSADLQWCFLEGQQGYH